MKKFIKLNEIDNVATALDTLEEGTVIKLESANTDLVLNTKINFEHKFALVDINKGEKVFKYGIAIGIAYKDIKAGDHVHLHNLKSLMVEGVESDKEKLEQEWSNRI